MKLRDVVRPELVVVPLVARSVAQATERLLERLVEQGAVTDPDRLRATLRSAKLEQLVTVGDHAFLPHLRTDAVPGLIAALGVSATPIRWEKDPQRAARIVVLVLAPPGEAARYLQVLAAFARALTDLDTVQGMLSGGTPDAVLAADALDVELPGQLTVRDAMTPQVLAARPDQTLAEVARLMVDRDIHAVPVVDEGGALVGMVSHRELLRYLLPPFLQRATGSYRAPGKSQVQRGAADPGTLAVRDVMARKVLSVSADQALADVATLMNSKDVDRCPVVRDGAVVGFLTRADLVRRLVAV